MSMRRLALVVACAVMLAAAAGARAQPTRLAAPNVVEVSPQLVTAGQPTAQALAGLKAQGFEAVIYLAQPDVPDAVRDEQLIVTRQGLAFINIPIPFDQPTEADFDVFAAVLGALRGRKVLVHCQVNFRASSMVFLYRTIALKEPPLAASQALQNVWSPNGTWRRFIESQLRKNGIAFELI